MRTSRGEVGPGCRRSATSALAATALVAASLLAGWLWTAAGAVEPSPRSPRSIYLADCAACHGADARGTAHGPSLQGVGAAALDYELSTGRMPIATAVRTDEPDRPVRPDPEISPSWSGTRTERHDPAYPPEVIAALTRYVAELAGGDGPAIPEVVPGDVAHGGELYRLNCAACHAWGGSGGALVEREAPPLDRATSVQVAEAVRIGPGRMPAFGAAALSDQDVDDLAAYVRELQASQDRGGTPLAHLGPFGEGAVAGAALVLLLFVVRAMGERG